MERQLTEQVLVVQGLVAASRAANTYKASGVDRSGYDELTLLVDVGAVAAGGTLDVKLQDSETDVDGNYADITAAAIVQVVAANKAPSVNLDCSPGKVKKYVRAVAVVGTAAVACSATYLLSKPHTMPVTQTVATVYA